MKRFFESIPRWVLILVAVAAAAGVTFLVVHLAGGGMAGMH